MTNSRMGGKSRSNYSTTMGSMRWRSMRWLRNWVSHVEVS